MSCFSKRCKHNIDIFSDLNKQVNKVFDKIIEKINPNFQKGSN